MAQQMSIDTDKVGAAVNRISLLTGDIKTRTDAFVAKLEEQNSATGNKWSLLLALQKKLVTEQKNIDGIIEAQEEIKRSLDRYAEMAAEADDDSAFRG